MQKIKALLFDVDGTLLDSRALILASFQYTLKKFEYTIPSEDSLIAYIGKPLNEVYFSITGKEDSELYCRTHYAFQLEHLDLSKPYPQAGKTLSLLKENGYKIAIVTTRRMLPANSSLELAGLTEYIDAFVYAEDITNFKPHPEPFLKALSILHESKDNAIVVGDTEADILGGKNAGIRTVGAMYGFRGEKIKEYNPDFLISDISEVLQILETK